MGEFLIVVLVAIAVSLIAFVMKELLQIKRNDRSLSNTITDISWPVAGNGVYEGQQTQEDRPMRQITLYAYYNSKPHKRCPYCDAENDVYASRCNVCGTQL